MCLVEVLLFRSAAWKLYRSTRACGCRCAPLSLRDVLSYCGIPVFVNVARLFGLIDTTAIVCRNRTPILPGLGLNPRFRAPPPPFPAPDRGRVHRPPPALSCGRQSVCSSTWVISLPRAQKMDDAATVIGRFSWNLNERYAIARLAAASRLGQCGWLIASSRRTPIYRPVSCLPHPRARGQRGLARGVSSLCLGIPHVEAAGAVPRGISP